MAFNLSNIAYDGQELAMEIIRDTFASSLLLDKFGARIIPSLKSKFVWHSTSMDLNVNAGTPLCPTFDTNFTLTQNNGELCAYHVSSAIPHDSLIGTYREVNYAQGVLNERVSDDTQVFASLIAMITEGVRVTNDSMMINNNYLYDCQNGLLEQFESGDYTASNSIQRPVPSGQKLTGVAITPANVQVEMSRVINALPGKYKYGTQSSLFGRPKFAVSYDIADAFWQSLTYTAPVATAGTGNYDQLFAPSFRGYEIVPIDGLPEGTMFLTPGDNIAIVFDSENDLTNLVIADGLQDSTLCKVLKFRLDWRTAVFFGEGDAVVYYRPA